MKKNYTHVSILIDRSGSMQSIKTDVIGGFNQLMEDQKKEPGDLTVSLIQFDENEGKLDFNIINDFAPLNEVKLLTETNYIPRGSTPLNDSLAKLINETGSKLARLSEDQRPEKVLVVIMTDGMENASREHTKATVKTLIEHQENNYNWKFIYIGANQDAFAEGMTRGIGSTMNYAATSKGTRSSIKATSLSMSKMRGMSSETLKSYTATDDLNAEYKKEMEKED